MDWKTKLKELAGNLPGAGFLLLMALVIYAVVVLLCGTLMTFFGFRYADVESLLWYFLSAEVVGLPLDLLTQGLCRTLYTQGKASAGQANSLYIPLEAMGTAFSLWLADHWVTRVSATGLSLLVVGLATALLTLPVRKNRK